MILYRMYRRPIITATTTTTTTTTTTPRNFEDLLKISEHRTPILSSTSSNTPATDLLSHSTMAQDGVMDSTTSLPLLMSSFDLPRKIGNHPPSYLSLKLDQERGSNVIDGKKSSEVHDSAHKENDGFLGKNISKEEHNQKQFHLMPHKSTRLSETASQTAEDAAHKTNLNNEQVKLYHHQDNYFTAAGSVKTDSQPQQHFNDPSKIDVLEQDEVAEIEEPDDDDDDEKTEKYLEDDKDDNEDSANIVPTHDHNGNVDADGSLLHERYDLSSLRHPGDAVPTSVELRLKQITQEVQKRTRNDAENHHLPHSLTPDLDDIGHQSFLSLSDLIRTLRPNDKQIIPQIDSDYSNAMRVLGEKSVVVNNDQQ